MSAQKICIAALASALAATLFTAWLMHEGTINRTTLPPLIFSENGEGPMIWGAWKTIEGFDAPGIHTTEIRCNKARMNCIEGVGVLLIHDEGQDLDAQVYEYRVDEWSETVITATAITPMAECLKRKLSLQLKDKAASVSWAPGPECENGDKGKAVLIGDPL